MSTSITTAFVRDYNKDFQAVFQRPGASLRDTVRTKDNIIGKSTTFQKIGKGSATTKARHGVITPMNQSHTAPVCTLEDFYAGDWYDKLDEAKVNHDERMAIAQGGAWALGRKVDDQILTALDATPQTTLVINVTSGGNIRAGVLTWIKDLFDNDVANDGQIYGVISPHFDAVLSLVDQYASSDFVNLKPFTEGSPVRTFRRWNGVLWTVHTGLNGIGGSTTKGFLYHKSAIGYAAGALSGNVSQTGGKTLSADITWHGDRAAHFINHWMSGGACLIDDSGVIEANWSETGSIPTS